MKVKLSVDGAPFACACGGEIFYYYPRLRYSYRCVRCRRFRRDGEIAGRFSRSGEYLAVSALKLRGRAQQVAQIRRLCAERLTRREIMERTGATLWLVRDTIHKLRSSRPPVPQNLSPFKERNQTIAAQYAAGLPVAALAAAHRLSENTIKDILKKLKAHRAPDYKPPRPNEIRDRDIFYRYCKGTSARLLARMFRLDRCHVLKIIRNQRAGGMEFEPMKGEKP